MTSTSPSCINISWSALQQHVLISDNSRVRKKYFLNICGIKCSRFNENDLLVHFNFGVHEIPWFQIVKKIWCKYVTVFLNFLSNYILCHLLESPHWGDSNGMPQYIVSWNVYKISQILIGFSFLSEPGLSCGYGSVLKIRYCRTNILALFAFNCQYHQN